METQKSIYQYGTDEIVEKKSRFIGEVFPISSAEEVEIYLEEVRKKYWDASHHVYAYRLSGKVPVEKASDDGEPARTAGFPILSILQNEGLQNVLVIVTRYFGGTLLGTGGLVRAYSAAAQAALKAGGVIEKQPGFLVSLKLDYTLLGKIEYLLAENGWPKLHTRYEDQVILEVLVAADQRAAFEKKIEDAGRGTLVPTFVREVLSAVINEKIVFFDE